MTDDQVFLNGIIGMLCSTLGIISTLQEQLDWGVRFTGGCLGLAIAAFTLYRLICPRKL